MVAEEPTYRVAVRALCQFTAKGGDLDRRFTPAPTGQQGMVGHGIVASRRGAQYQTEVALGADVGLLRVRGRADGYLPAARRLEECKTHRGAVERVATNHRVLHWAQLQTYGALLCQRDALEQVNLALVYFDIESGQETVVEETWLASALLRLFQQRCAAFVAWAQKELQHKARRDASLATLTFPFGALHAQQRVLAEAAYRAVARREVLLAEAPTGVGKTLGTLFPLLKALAAQKLDKIFYLTAKSTGRALALDAVARLRRVNPQLHLRVLDLVARDKACVFPGKQCQGDSCPLARGFYDRVAAAREAVLDCEVMTQAALRAVALRHEVCPYYLSQEMVRWSDVVIADYNHYFDSSALLYALLRENEWRIGLLVDEAHNLVNRARQMYSASLAHDVLQAAIAAAPATLRPVLKRIAIAWGAVPAPRPARHAVLEEVPAAMRAALRDGVAQLADWSVAQTEPLAQAVQQLQFAALDFLRLTEEFASHSILDCISSERRQADSFNLRNVIPAAFLASRFAAAQATILFSATLSPPEYFQAMLGLRDARCLVVGSPFAAEQLDVRIVADVSTRFRHRAQSLSTIVELVAAQFARRPGNYLLFTGGFEYLRQIENSLRLRFPDIPLWSQTPAMPESERSEFAARFTATGQGIGLAVLGGAFAEGIDLPGPRLIGAFVLTLGLPAVSAVNEAISARLQQSTGRGYEYTYLNPGIQRVVQAAGRVIRGTSDRGILYLVDSRYTLPAVAKLLPSWWQVTAVLTANRTRAGCSGTFRCTSDSRCCSEESSRDAHPCPSPATDTDR